MPHGKPTPEQIIEQAKHVRELQKAYFARRDREVLNAAQKQERILDKMIAV